MKITDLIKKLLENSSLTEEERKFLVEYDPDKDESRIPKSRLDQESEKRKSAESRASELQSSLEEIQEKLENLENSGVTETEKLKRDFDKQLLKLKNEVASITSERDKASKELESLKRTSKIGEIAAKFKFTDPGYLDFLTSKNSLELDDDNAVSIFIKGLESTIPQMFQSSIKPGSGTSSNPNNSGVDAVRNRIDELLKKPELSSREAGEVINLQSQLEQTNPETKE